MTLYFPEYALKCIDIIESSGHEAYFVGGCVRDGLLGRRCEDIDITTSALPDEIISMFEHTVPTGIKHGTVTVMIDQKSVEITTYRTEEGYADSRHPTGVNFVRDITEDLKRRDFTINALAYNPRGGLVDLFGGLSDLSERIIRTVGDPQARFGEDALRILRAFRFASFLGFRIEDRVINAAQQLAQLINKVSGERVLQELSKLANGAFPDVIVEFCNASSLSNFGIGPLQYDKALLQKLTFAAYEKDFILPLFISLFEHDTETIKRTLRPDNKLISHIRSLDAMALETRRPDSKADLKLMLYKYGMDDILLYLSYIRLFSEEQANFISGLLNEIEANNEPFCVSMLAIDGKDLLALGYSGPDVGVALNRLVLYVIENPEKNDRTELIKYIKN